MIINRIRHWIAYSGWYAMKLNLTNPNQNKSYPPLREKEINENTSINSHRAVVFIYFLLFPRFLWDFDIQTHHLITARRPDLIIINKKKRTCKIVDFAVPADHRIKLKESEKKDKYRDLAKELKKLWNMKVTIIPIVIGAFGTVTKGLLKRLEDWEVGGQMETIQTTALLERLEYWEECWRLEGTCCRSISSERPSANADVKNSNE